MNMKETKFNPEASEKLDNIIRDSYDDFVRMERRNLLIVSSISIFSYFVNIDLKNSSIFGLKILNMNETVFLILLILLSLYFLVAFIIYAIPGFNSAKKEWKEVMKHAMIFSSNHLQISTLLRHSSSTVRYYIWLFLNYIFPSLLGLIAIIMLIIKMI